MMLYPVLSLTVLGMTVLASPSPAGAQTMEPQATPVCEGGRVVDAATRGRCCWPGQAWSPQTGRCAGPPTCPAGLTPQGDDCVPQSGAGYSSPVVVVPHSPPLPPPLPEEPEEGSRPTMGLVIPGAILFGVPYILTAVLAGLVAEVSPEDNDGLVNLIPVAGPWVCLATCNFSSGEEFWRTPLVIDGILQAAGVTMFILGFVLRKENSRSRVDLFDQPGWAFTPWLSDRAGGIRYTVYGF